MRFIAPYLLAFVVGGFVGPWIASFSHPNERVHINSQSGESRSNRPKLDRQVTAGGAIDGILRSELKLSNPEVGFEENNKKMHDEVLSPQRTSAFLAYWVQMRGSKELMDEFEKGKIGTPQELDSAVRRLAEENPDEVWKLYSEQKIGYQSWDGFKTVNGAIVKTLTDNDAPAMLQRLEKLERNRNSIYIADSFGAYWASSDPAAAALKLNEVGKVTSSADAFAEQIVKSWSTKDPNAMMTYINQLSDDQSRQLFQNALKKLNHK